MDACPSDNQQSTRARESNPAAAAELFAESVRIMARLRGPDGCPWDREQSFDSIRKYTLEETYEVFDAIEQRDFAHLAEELGDLLLQVLFYAEMAANEGRFTIAEVLDGLNQKLVRRHPHVFGEEAARLAGNGATVDPNVKGSSAAVLRNWEEIKRAERLARSAGSGSPDLLPANLGSPTLADPTQPAPSQLDEVQRAMPALAEAAKLGAVAAKSGFDWSTWRDLLPKMTEELAELEDEAAAASPTSAVEAEMGDVLFTAVNLARHLGVDAEMALRGCNLRFRRRFHLMEQLSPQPLKSLSPADLESLWAEAKQRLAAEEREQ